MLDISRVLTVTVLTESILLLHHPSILSSDLFSLITFSIPPSKQTIYESIIKLQEQKG